ncbi:MAG TPA: retropepsin-like aspartic protease [Patescibacteria group bacterium]
MIRAIFPSDAFVLKQRSIKAKVQMYTSKVAAEAQALIDSGATENFISPSFISRYNIPTHSLSKPKIVRNVDGTKNQNGNIEELVNFKIAYLKLNGQLKRKMQTFLILDLGEDDMILGYPFLQATNPEINWTEGNIKGTLWASTEDIAEVRKSANPDKPKSKIKAKVNQFKQWIKRTTVATQLAIRKAPKQELPWHKQIPKEYHKYHKVFNEQAAQRFPQTRPWDHAIDLQPNASKTLDCKLYPLAPGEQDSLDLFIKDHLKKGYI